MVRYYLVNLVNIKLQWDRQLIIIDRWVILLSYIDIIQMNRHGTQWDPLGIIIMSHGHTSQVIKRKCMLTKRR